MDERVRPVADGRPRKRTPNPKQWKKNKTKAERLHTVSEESLTVNDLPNEILGFILEYVPPYKDLDNCRLVCKKWLYLVTDLRNKRKKAVINNTQLENIALDAIGNNGSFIVQAICRYKNVFYVLGRNWEPYEKLVKMYKFDITTKTWELIITKGDIPEEPCELLLLNYEDELFFLIEHLFFPRMNFVEMFSYNIKSRTWLQRHLQAPFSSYHYSYFVHEGNVIVYMTRGPGFHILNLTTMSWWEPKQLNPLPGTLLLQHIYTENNNCYFLEHDEGAVWIFKVNVTNKDEVWMSTKIVVENWHKELAIMHYSSFNIDNYVICFGTSFNDSDELELRALTVDLSAALEEKKVKLELIKPCDCSMVRKILFIEFPGVNFHLLKCPCHIHGSDQYQI